MQLNFLVSYGHPKNIPFKEYVDVSYTKIKRVDKLA